MRIAFGLVVVAVACDAGRKDAPGPLPAPTPRVVADAAVVVTLADAPLPAGPTLLRPVGMTGPFPTIDDACESAKPCGFTELDDHGNAIKPPTTTDCAMGRDDPNAVEPGSIGQQAAEIDHVTAKGIELRIGSQSCAVPKAIRGEQDIYFMFVKRADGWWRSDALWQYSYNDKYVDGTMHVRWNDQPRATFAGIAAGIDELDCEKQGDSQSTEELMVRVEAGSAHPLVWAPLVVGRRYAQAKRSDGAPDVACPTINRATELDEKWSSPDDLTLTGEASWNEMDMDATNGLLTIGFAAARVVPSSAGDYRFVR
jgi:hypothetical protein